MCISDSEHLNVGTQLGLDFEQTMAMDECYVAHQKCPH